MMILVVFLIHQLQEQQKYYDGLEETMAIVFEQSVALTGKYNKCKREKR